MKKVFLMVIIAMFMLTCVGNASQVRKTLIASTTLDADPTSVTGDINIGDADRVGFIVVYDETEVGGGLSVAITMHVSYDGTTWISSSFLDYAGGPATFQTSETLSSDTSYVCWLEPDAVVPQVRMTITATGSDIDDTADVVAYIVQDK